MNCNSAFISVYCRYYFAMYDEEYKPIYHEALVLGNNVCLKYPVFHHAFLTRLTNLYKGDKD